MSGSPTYTADTAIDSTNGDNYPIFGSFSVANSATTVTGFGTLFTTRTVLQQLQVLEHYLQLNYK